MNETVHSVWVVGAGLLGSELARFWRAQGARVLTIDKKAKARVHGDAAERDTLSEATIILPDPDVITICVSTRGGSAMEYRRAYLDTVEALSTARPEARLIFCSSTGLYPDTAGREVSEQTPCEPVDDRDRVLLQAEQLVRSSGGVVARLAALYGFGRCEILRRHVSHEPLLPGAEDRVFNYVYVADAARALYLLADPKLQGGDIWNVCGESYTKREVYAMIERISKIPASAESSPVGKRRGTKNHRVSSGKMRSLGWFPRMDLEHFTEVELFENEESTIG